MFFGLFAASCSYTQYYQVASVKPADNNTKQVDNKIVYEDNNLLIYYDFWSANGNMCLTFENKNEDNLILHLDESFLIYNGYTYDYFQNRYFVSKKEHSMSITKARKSAVTSLYSAYQTSVQKEESTIVKENAKIIIPGKGKRVINEFNILESRYRSCNLLCDYLGSDGLDSISFTAENSPYCFENKFVYSLEDSEKMNISNKFYISDITNCTDEAFMKTRSEKGCPDDDEYDERIDVIDYLFYAPNRCYITYVITMEDGKH